MKFGIAFRLGLLLALVGVLAAGLTGLYAYRISRDLLIQSAKSELLTSTQVLARRITLTREEISRNLQILSTHPAALSVLQHAQSVEKEQLATLFKVVMAANPRYFEVRLIAAGDYGIERVRIDRDDAQLIRVEGDDLQEKGHYPYVYETLKLPAGKTYMSRIAINRERGAHSGLDQPTVQLATPVVDPDGKALGVVVIDVDLNGMFALLAKDLPKDFQLFFLNHQGDYLIHPDPALTFGFDKGRRVLAQDEFPELRPLVDGKVDHVLLEASTGRYAKTPMVAAFIGRRVQVVSDHTSMILGLAQPLTAIQAQVDTLGRAMLRSVLGLCLLCVLLAALMARAVTRPINAMSAAVQRFATTHLSEGLPTGRGDEIGVLARAFQEMQGQISQQMAELQRRQEELAHQARHDPLTGLPNRALFADRFEQVLASARRNQGRFALMFIDLDRLKAINDNLGHGVGDQLLKAVATRIQGALRESDTVARVGGDEFVALLPQIQHNDDVLGVAEKIRQAIAEPVAIDQHTLTVSASIGIAMYPNDGEDLIALTKCADSAMYRAKEGGRDAVVFHQPG
jgi:diguanylate cyclase